MIENIEDWSFVELINSSDSLIESIKMITESVIYRIYDDNGKSYIGTSRNFYNRLYNKFHGHVTSKDRDHCDFIHKVMKDLGYNKFRIQILKKSTDYSEIENEEPKFIEYYDSYNNGYNRNNTGKIGPGIGSVSMYSEEEDIYVRVKPSEVNDYLNRGFIRRSPNKWSKQMISPNGEFCQVPIEKCEQLLSEGYTIVGFSKGLKWIYSYEDDDYFMVTEEKAKELISNNLAKAESPSKNLVNVYKEELGINIRIPKDQLDEYLLNGFKQGNFLIKGKISVINDLTDECRRIDPSEKDEYLNKGWRLGSRKRIVLFNPITGRQVSLTDHKKLNLFLDEGFIKGMCRYNGKTILNNGNEFISVNNNEVPRYKELGYNRYGKLF